jgi:hypothetical protein
MPIEPDVMTIVQHLSRYLRQHPEACDTPEGIARWWLDADPPPVPVAAVESALGWMSAVGVVESSRAADGRVRYRRAGDIDDLDARLHKLSEDPQSLMPADPSKRPPRIH